MKFKLKQKVTRKELTVLLCQEEIKYGLITNEKQLMQVSIIDGRFAEYTAYQFKIKWTDDLCYNGVVEASPYYSPSLNEGIIDTSEYEEK